MDNTPDYCTVVFTLADETYRELKQQGIWDKSLRPDVDNASAMVNTPSNRSSSPTTTKFCWNCGDPDCNVMTCPKPKDPERIDANRKLFYRNKKEARENAATPKPKDNINSKAIPHAWRPPEPHEQNKRIIHGRPYTYNPAKPGWDEDHTPSSGLTSTHGLTTTSSQKADDATALTELSATPVELQHFQLEVANLIRSMSSSIG